MWVYTTHGFYSVVSMPDDPEVVLVRGRDRQSLVNLVELLAESHPAGTYVVENILVTPYRDYPYRIVILRDDWVHYLERYAYDKLRYPNFKNACHDAGFDPQQLNALSDVWGVMYSDWADRPGREERSWA